MACVTLKRSLDFDPLYSPNRSNKRRRCLPMHCATPEKRMREEEPAKPASCFKDSSLTPEQIANNLRDEIKRMKKRRQIVEPSSPGSAPSSPEPMMDMMEQQAMPPTTSAANQQAIVGTSSGRFSSSTTQHSPLPSASQQELKEKPIFTLKQMTLIAERMCKERVDQVRQEFEEILQQKLSEQYDSFVKFIDHQIQRRFQQSQAPSYLS
jgi:hypothetical protein